MARNQKDYITPTILGFQSGELDNKWDAFVGIHCLNKRKALRISLSATHVHCFIFYVYQHAKKSVTRVLTVAVIRIVFLLCRPHAKNSLTCALLFLLQPQYAGCTFFMWVT